VEPAPVKTSAHTLTKTKFEFLEIRPMGIFSRTRDIIAANVTDLLDRAEDPAKMIRMIIMEMEETLVEVRASAARTIADQKEMKRAMIKAQQAVQDWQDKAELALFEGPGGSGQGRAGRKEQGQGLHRHHPGGD